MPGRTGAAITARQPRQVRASDRRGAVVGSMQAGSIQAGSASFRTAQLGATPVIEQAKGILMAQHGCGPEEAFDLLRRASQRFNVPVRVLAVRLAHRVQRPGAQAAPIVPAAARDSGAAPALGALLDEVLAFALTLLHAERGNIQLADPATGALRIAAQRGFGSEFMEYFAAV